MCPVADAPDDKRGRLTMEGSRVGERRDVLANFVRVGIVFLKLNPLRLLRESGQPPDEGKQFFRVHTEDNSRRTGQRSGRKGKSRGFLLRTSRRRLVLGD